MMLSSILLIITCCALYFQLSYGNAASATDISAAFPANWCNKNYGTATRTTGECICKVKCAGDNCVNQHGLSFYAYKNCPTCTCLPADKANISDTVLVREPMSCSADEEEEEMDEMMAMRSSRQKSGRAEYRGVENGDLDSSLTISEWLEDNGRAVFAVCASLTVLGLIMMFLLVK